MLDNQFGFSYKEYHQLIPDLLNVIIEILEYALSYYNITYKDVVYLEFRFKPVDIKLSSEFKLSMPKDLALLSTKPLLNKMNIPVSINLHNEINCVIENNKIVNIPININGKIVNFF